MSRREAYDVKFKMEVIAVAEKCSNREAGRQFKIDESMVRRWRQNKSKLELAYHQPGLASKKKKLGVGRKPWLSTIEDDLMGKIVHEREQQHHVPYKLIQAWAQEMAQDNGITEFRASRGWLCNFMRRHNLTVRSRTANGQSLPDYKDKAENYVEFNKKEQDLLNHAPSMINVSETGINANKD
eukprot:gene4894-21227_t